MTSLELYLNALIILLMASGVLLVMLYKVKKINEAYKETLKLVKEMEKKMDK
jgi:hypothetical protein